MSSEKNMSSYEKWYFILYFTNQVLKCSLNTVHDQIPPVYGVISLVKVVQMGLILSFKVLYWTVVSKLANI